jgi:RNA polymerase sigma factor (sigma-70 family)
MINIDSMNLIQSMLIGNWKFYKLTKVTLPSHKSLQYIYWKYLAVKVPHLDQISWASLEKLVLKAPGYRRLSIEDKTLVKNGANELNIKCSQKIKKIQISLGINATPEIITWYKAPKNPQYLEAHSYFKTQTNKITQSLALIRIPELRKYADIMLYSCYPFMRHYSKRVDRSSYNFGAPLEDRFQNVAMGYLASTMTWEAGKRAKFTTYGQYNGRSIASRSDVDNHMQISFPPSFIQVCKNLIKEGEIARIRISYENPHFDYFKIESLVVKELGNQLKNVLQLTSSLGHPLDYEDCDATIEKVEMIADLYSFDELSFETLSTDIEDPLFLEQRGVAINLVLSLLSPREGQVLQMRFFEEMTLQGISEVLDITRERTRQIEAKAMRKLRQGSRNRLLKSFVNVNSISSDGEMSEVYHNQEVQEFLTYHHEKLLESGLECERLFELIATFVDQQSTEVSKFEIINKIFSKLAPLARIQPSSLTIYEGYYATLDGVIDFPHDLDTFLKEQLQSDTPLVVQNCIRTFRKNPGLFSYIFD